MPWFAGIDRKKINWCPTINLERCTKCGMCMNCGKHVFEWTDDGPVVARPLECVVGCTTCRTLCEGNAIHFPSVSQLRKTYEANHVWAAVKAILIRKGKIPTEDKTIKARVTG